LLRSLASISAIGCALGVVSCGSSSGAPGDGSSGSLDGVWDITSANTGMPAEMTIAGGTVEGFIAKREEGKVVYGADCVATKSRTEFAIAASGNAITGTRTEVLAATGSTCPDWINHANTQTFSGVRTRSAPATQTDLNGDWTVNGLNSTWNATVDGLTVSATGKLPDTQDRDTLTISVAGGIVTVASNAPGLSFAARKR